MKQESLKERIARLEEQREADVKLNTDQHTDIQQGISGINALLGNHLAHTDRWLWVLASGLVLAIIPYAVYVVVEIIKHVMVAKAVAEV